MHLYVYDWKLCDTDHCVGAMGVYRISFALAIFFITTTLVSLCLPAFDKSWWAIKMLLYSSYLVLAFVIPNDFFTGYVHLSRGVAGIFLLVQIILLIDMAYRWNESWVGDEENNRRGLILIVCGLMYAASLVLLVFFFRWFAGSGCHLEQFFLAFTIVITLGFSLLSIWEKVEHGALLPSAVMTLYCYWVAYSALSSDPSPCNTTSSHEVAHLVVGLIVAAVSLTWAGYSLASGERGLFDGYTQAPDGAAAHAASDEQSNRRTADAIEAAHVNPSSSSRSEGAHLSSDATAASLSEEQKAERSRTLKFHSVMACSAMYMAMVLTNWGSPTTESSSSDDAATHEQGSASMWIKIVSQWIAAGLYYWSLVAPLVFPDRDFS